MLETDRQTDRDRDRERQRETVRETEIETDRDRDRQTDRQRQRQTRAIRKKSSRNKLLSYLWLRRKVIIAIIPLQMSTQRLLQYNQGKFRVLIWRTLVSGRINLKVKNGKYLIWIHHLITASAVTIFPGRTASPSVQWRSKQFRPSANTECSPQQV